MIGVRIDGAVLLVLLGTSLLTQITGQCRSPARSAPVCPMKNPYRRNLLGIETVDLRNGNLQLESGS